MGLNAVCVHYWCGKKFSKSAIFRTFDLCFYKRITQNIMFKKQGNSRDDKSNNSTGRRAGNGDQPRNSSSPRTRNAASGGFKKSDDGAPKKRFGSDSNTDKKPFSSSRRSTGSFNADEKQNRSFGNGAAGDKKPYAPRGSKPDATGGDRPFKKNSDSRGSSTEKPFGRTAGSRGGSSADKPFGRTAGSRGGSSAEKPFAKFAPRSAEDKPRNRRPPETNNVPNPNADKSFKRNDSFGGEKRRTHKPRNIDNAEGGAERKPYSKALGSSRSWDNRTEEEKNAPKRDRSEFEDERPTRVIRGRNKKAAEKADDHLIRLNRYIANAGICSRRKADELIAAGVVSVNGEVISELGHKVDPSKDVIRYNGETLKREKMVYVLLNKPKDYITTTDDPQERRTIIYPVGRLDRNTTGLILMTNDGDLADKLSHPRNSVTKLYQVELDKPLTQGDLNKIQYGLELEDGIIKPDIVAYVTGGTKREVGIQIHSGKNRIVRRIFEHLGYDVVKLDRTIYAGLTKKDLPRGRWRYLDEKEVIQLKHLVQM
jgi:23S rRNA pseudouridine2605 synthase